MKTLNCGWTPKLNKAGSCHETLDKGHDRIELGLYSLSNQIDWLEQKPDWSGLQALWEEWSRRALSATKPRWNVDIICVRSPI